MITQGNFTFTETSIQGLYIVDVRKFGDERGYFMETYRASDFAAAGLSYTFIQDNQSASKGGVLRGLHFQKTYPQAKLVRALKGSVFDVAVDLREGSPTYGKWEGVLLSEENRRQFLIPRGFAHGFAVVSDYAEFAYKCDNAYHPEDEGGLRFDDPTVGVVWPETARRILSEKDQKLPFLADVPFAFKEEVL